jgi:glycosyltransferase involved in cell wall biosynthesis
VVSAIIPARNEEVSIARAVESVAAQPEVDEVIVVDDQSSDRTAEILRELATRIPKLKVLQAGTLPAGWVGKNHAVAIGAAAAQGDWLLFTDADTYHYMGSTRRALADAVDHNAVLVSYSPEQEMDSYWERALTPFVYCRLAARYSYTRVSDPKFPDAAANGQYLMVLRDVYESVGGHAAVAAEILEDVVLARNVKRAGYSIYFTAPLGVVRTRMYRSFGAMWQGWTKNLYPLMGGNWRSLVVELRLFNWSAGIAWAVFWIYLTARYQASPWVGLGQVLVLIAGLHLGYGVALYRNLFPPSDIKYFVPASCLYKLVLIASWWKNTRGSVVWKGRAYPARTQ